MSRRLSQIAICVATVLFAAACRTERDSTRTQASSGSTVAPGPSGAGSATAVGSASASAASAHPDAFPIPAATVDAIVNPQGLPVYDGPTGSIEGTIRVKGPEAPPVHVNAARCLAALDTYGKLFREGPADPSGGPRALADAVVVAIGTPGDSAFYVPEKNPDVRVTIGPSCAYPARTIALTYGQRLEVSNNSAQLFAPFIDDAQTPAVMVAPPFQRGDPIKIYPTRAGRFTLTDRLELFVHEDLYVFRHSLHAVSDRDGHYRIDGVPVGKRKIGVHHPAIESDAETGVDVVKDAVQKVDLTIRYTPPPPPKRSDAGLPPARLQND